MREEPGKPKKKKHKQQQDSSMKDVETKPVFSKKMKVETKQTRVKIIRNYKK